MLSVGGLFSGIGGIELGLERAGMRVLWHCEQDAYARAVLEERWPGVPCYEDVRELRGADVAPVDVLCGGFPCQDISLAGAGVGIDGARSGLWSEYARLVGELRPRYVVVENVAALLGRGLERVLGDLAALGYDAEWDCIPACAVGAPHLRDRLWLVAYPGGEQHQGSSPQERRSPAPRLPQGDPDAHCGRLEVSAQPDSEPPRPGEHASLGNDADRLRDDVADAQREQGGQRRGPDVQRRRQDEAEQAGLGGRGGGTLAHTEREGLQGRTGLGLAGTGRPSGEPAGERQGLGGQWLPEPDVGRVAHGVPARVDRLRCLGNAVVPQIPEWIGLRILEWEATGTPEQAEGAAA